MKVNRKSYKKNTYTTTITIYIRDLRIYGKDIYAVKANRKPKLRARLHRCNAADGHAGIAQVNLCRICSELALQGQNPAS